MRLFKRTVQRQDTLDAAIGEWHSRKSDEYDVLSRSAREAVRRDAFNFGDQHVSRLSELFTPTRRLALTGVIPAIALAAVLGFVAKPWDRASVGYDTPSQPIHASKMNGEVVFMLANGDHAHSVYRSTQPDQFGKSPAFQTMRGSFSDSLRSGPDLVFYRVD